jgi:MFS family permease
VLVLTAGSPKRRQVERRRGRLWRHAGFLRLWAAESVSLLGDQITLIALPTVAILTLDASTFQVVLLSTFAYVAYPIVAPFAGLAVDRLARRRVMIVADLVRLAVLASIPIAFALDRLSLLQLFVVALVTSVFAVLFDIAYQAYLPSLVHRDDLAEGNAKLEMSRSVSDLAGPGLAGFAVQVLGAPLAVAVDAVSFLASAIGIGAIRAAEPPRVRQERLGWRSELADGIRQLRRHSVVMRATICGAIANVGIGMLHALLFLFAYRVLRLQPGQVGVVLSVGGLGGVLGAVSAGRVMRRLGLGPTLPVTSFLQGLFLLGMPLAAFGPHVLPFAAGFALSSFFHPIWNVASQTLRQAVTPDHLQGRVHAAVRTISWGAIPVGSLVGGVIASSLSRDAGQRTGLVVTLVIACMITMGGCLVLVSSPARLRALRDVALE